MVQFGTLLAMIYTTVLECFNRALAQEIMQPKGRHELFTRVAQMEAWSPVFTIWGNQFNPIIFGRMMTLEPYREAVRLHLMQRLCASIQVYSSSNSTLRRHCRCAQCITTTHSMQIPTLGSTVHFHNICLAVIFL